MKNKIVIRPIQEADRQQVKDMMRVFYASEAVSTNGSDEIFDKDIDACIGVNPYLDGYVIEKGDIVGYSMVAKTFSTEFGCPCFQIEDLYVKDICRGQGIGNAVFDFLEATYKNAMFRLEVEEENEGAVRLYRKRGYKILPYFNMIKL